MWDLSGLELTGVYGTWSERSYELTDLQADSVTLLMSAEDPPGPEWTHRLPDEFYGESVRWALTVSRAEVTDIHNTIVQGTVGGVFVDVLAQRFDGSWAVSAQDTDDIAQEVLRRLNLVYVPASGAWSGWLPQAQVTITGRASYVAWPQPCS